MLDVLPVNTKAEVRFHVATADWLSKDVQNVITAKVSCVPVYLFFVLISFFSFFSTLNVRLDCL